MLAIMTTYWHPEAPTQDKHIAFRVSFFLTVASRIDVRLLGASWFTAYMDGVDLIAEGPHRFPVDHPEVSVHPISLAAGKHVIAIHATYVGVSNRLMLDILPFVLCDIQLGGIPLTHTWKCLHLPSYSAMVRRINPQLGWVEWCDTRNEHATWKQPQFDDSAWVNPVVVNRNLGPLRDLRMQPVVSVPFKPKEIAHGNLVETFGYEADNPPARLFLRELSPRETPPDGEWKRFDLGRIRLGRPRIRVQNMPVGTVIEVVTSEYLSQGRVAPWITLSAGDSSNMWHFVCRGGDQVLEGLIPLGGRFVEVHCLDGNVPGATLSVEWLDRGYYGTVQGSLETGDRVLDAVWKAGVATFQACAEDAIIDNPTRERGAWTGDAVAAGLDIAGVVFTDQRLTTRCLEQCAYTARVSDGLIPGMAVGDPIFIPTYAAAWVTGCIRQAEVTGSIDHLHLLFPAAERNAACFIAHQTAAGITDGLGWSFVDWGYKRPEGPTDIGLNLHCLGTFRDMERWCQLIGKPDVGMKYAKHAGDLAASIAAWFDARLAGSSPNWKMVGYHAAALGLKHGCFKGNTVRTAGAVGFIKLHILACFPNRLDAPRLANPSVVSDQLMTPYFAHYAFPALIEEGEMEFVLGQIRTCWGWMLSRGHTTILEVFDERWSHCHQWSAGPTWIMSRYLLGLHARGDRGGFHMTLRLSPGALPRAKGRMCCPNGGVARIAWERTSVSEINWTIDPDRPLYLDLGHGTHIRVGEKTTFKLREAAQGLWNAAEV